MIDLLTRIWIDNPELRLGQLLGNAINNEIDPYYIEDSKLEQLLRERYDVNVS